jgi:hypothetical protein
VIRRTVGAVVPVRATAPEHGRNLRAVVARLLSCGVGPVVVVEQRDPATLELGALEGVRREAVHFDDPLSRRGALLNRGLARIEAELVVLADPNVLLPEDGLRALATSQAVAVQLASQSVALSPEQSASACAGAANAGARETTDPRGAPRPAPLGKLGLAVEREVLLALGGASEDFTGTADEGLELARRLRRFFPDLCMLEGLALELHAPKDARDEAARSDNKATRARLAAALDADPQGYVSQRLTTSLPRDLLELSRLERDRARRAAFRATCPTPPPHVPKRLPGSLWAVTALFNPSGFRSRLDNYALFRAGLREAGVPLCAVELAFDDAPFELAARDAERLVQLRGGDVLWQKERLLNLAIEALPADCDKVVWLDADVLFERRDWAAATSARLEEVVALQPFSRSIRLGVGERAPGTLDLPVGSGDGEILHSMAYGVAARGPSCLGRYLEHGHCGYAWAARREVLARHGLYDANVLGNGDLNAAHAMFGGAAALKAERLSARARAHLERWADRLFADVRGSVGYIDGTLLHLWHGKKDDRRYLERLDVLIEHGFDPELDLQLDARGPLAWASHKPQLHARCREYFAVRREDG